MWLLVPVLCSLALDESIDRSECERLWQVIRENWNLKYSACFVLCPLRANQTAPLSVSVVSRLRVPPSNHLWVHALPTTTNTTGKLAVCIKPLHYNYNKVPHTSPYIWNLQQRWSLQTQYLAKPYLLTLTRTRCTLLNSNQHAVIMVYILVQDVTIHSGIMWMLHY